MPKDDPMMAQPSPKPSPPAELALVDVECSEVEISVGSAGASDFRVIAPLDPEVVARASRRRFTAEYKLRILAEADACTEPGAVGRLLRREGPFDRCRAFR